MRQSLPYSPDLCERLRAWCPPAARAVWLRPGTREQEVFCAYPLHSLYIGKQSVNTGTESGMAGLRHAPALGAEAKELLALLPATAGLEDLPFRGGLAGFLGYGPAPASTNQSFPSGFLGLFSSFIHVDHRRRAAEFVHPPALPRAAEWDDILDFVNGIALSSRPLPSFRLISPFQALTPRQRYEADFGRIQAYLQAGDCYQVNYAQAFRARCQGDSAAAMARLLAAGDPAYAAWVSLPEGDVLSLSPELFLRVKAGRVTTRPIKGTAPRDPDPARDAALRDTLAASPKDRAENLMIVDLLRHDLGRHAETGSVQVERLFEVETLPNVHHLVSTVISNIKKESHTIDLIRDCFPGGSVTGAPKQRAMEIIAELEPTPRSVYCGSVGFINADGDACLNIAIRTLLRLDDAIYAWAGGGIVADSECEAEYQECFHKIGAFMRALEGMDDGAAPDDPAGG